MQQYEWGGYTKLYGVKKFYNNNIQGSVYSKFKYKSMTYDAFINEDYHTSRHDGVDKTEIFNLKNSDNDDLQTIERISKTLWSRYRENSNTYSLRAQYNTDKIQISNRLTYTCYSTPANDNSVSLRFNPDIIGYTHSTSEASSKERYLAYNGYGFVVLSDKFSLNITVDYNHNQNRSNSLYHTNNALGIENNALETSNFIDFTPNLNWNLSDKHRLQFQGGASHKWVNIDYTGNSPSTQKYNIAVYNGVLGYTFLLPKFIAGAYGGWIWDNNSISDVKTNQNTPFLQIYSSWSLNSKHQLYLFVDYRSKAPSASQKSPNRLQENELMWYTGTPDLKDYKQFITGLSYTWLPNNRWQVTAEANYFLLIDRIISRYIPNGYDGSILRQYCNDGDYQALTVGFNAVGRFLNRKLVAQMHPQFKSYHTTGEYAWSKNELACSIQLSWYFGDFYTVGYYTTPSKIQAQQGGEIISIP